MGALVSLAHAMPSGPRSKSWPGEASIVYGDPRAREVSGADDQKGPSSRPCSCCDRPSGGRAVHDVEAFGPVTTLMPYQDGADAIALANRGKGSLVMSVFSYDTEFARDVVLGCGAVPRADRLHRSRQRQGDRRATARPCPTWSTAGRAGPAAAKSWEASAA